MFTQETMHATLIFAQTESHKIALYQLVGESSRGVIATRWNVRKKPSESDIQSKSCT